MTKAKTPLFVEIHQGFKNTDIRTRRNRVIEIGLKRMPFNPKSTDQQTVRDKYVTAYKEWNALTEAQKADYDAKGAVLGWSGWNYYLWKQYQFTIEETTLNPTDDAKFAEITPTTNYGSTADLLICPHRGGIDAYRSLLKFDYSGLPSGAEILEAKLKLYCAGYWGNGANLSVDIRKVSDDTWVEGTVTWNNQPAHGDVIATQATHVTDTWEEKDVTQYIKDEWGVNKKASVKLVCTDESIASNDGVNYASKEEDTHDPQLYIKYKAPV